MIVLTQKLTLPHRIDAGALVPAALAGLSLAQIEALSLKTGLKVGDVFTVAKSDGDVVVFRTQDQAVDCIGEGMGEGEIRVEGPAGRYAGRSMSGGTLHIVGDAGDGAGQGKSGGLLVVAGKAGDFVGSALPGRTSGVSGGVILIKGSVGQRFGDRMRKGVMIALGDAGDFCAARAVAGTIWVRGRLGQAPAQGLKRATLLLEHAPDALPTFQDCGVVEMPVLRLLLPSLDRLAGTRVADSSDYRAHRHLGCIGVDGRGEVLVLA